MKIAFASLLTMSVLSVSAPQQPSSLDYRFDEVRRSVTITTPKLQMPAQAGLIARSGDRVQTGWFSYALIASEHHRAKFEIFSSSEVLLAGGTPGVILSLERGRLHAMFDKITGSEPRMVQTPGALLAVRGTQYDVDVDSSGHTTLNVTEGVVEVRSEMREEPLFVRAGEMCTYGQHEPPVARPAPPHGMFDPDHRGREGSEPRGNVPEGSEHGHGTASPPSPPPSPRSHP